MSGIRGSKRTPGVFRQGGMFSGRNPPRHSNGRTAKTILAINGFGRTPPAPSAPAVPPVNPSAVPGLLAWWDASLPAQISTGPFIWTDITANMWEMTNMGAPIEDPTYGTVTQNGLNVIEFDLPTLQQMELDAGGIGNVEPWTMFVTGQFTDISVDRFMIDALSDQGSLHTNTGNWCHMNNIFGTWCGGIADTNWHTWAIRADTGGPNGFLRVDSLQVATFDSGPNGADRWVMGCRGAPFGNDHLIGYIAEVVIVDNAMSMMDICGVEEYLRQKWNTP